MSSLALHLLQLLQGLSPQEHLFHFRGHEQPSQVLSQCLPRPWKAVPQRGLQMLCTCPWGLGLPWNLWGRRLGECPFPGYIAWGHSAPKLSGLVSPSPSGQWLLQLLPACPLSLGSDLGNQSEEHLGSPGSRHTLFLACCILILCRPQSSCQSNPGRIPTDSSARPR